MSQTEEHNPATTRWTDDHDALVGFARVLVQSNVLLSPEDVIEYFENPWYRSREHQIWHDAGRPLPPSSDDLAEARFLGSGPRANELTSKHADDTARWNVFCDVIEAYENGGPPLAGIDGDS